MQIGLKLMIPEILDGFEGISSREGSSINGMDWWLHRLFLIGWAGAGCYQNQPGLLTGGRCTLVLQPGRFCLSH
jgi:hypothetical protein